MTVRLAATLLALVSAPVGTAPATSAAAVAPPLAAVRPASSPAPSQAERAGGPPSNSACSTAASFGDIACSEVDRAVSEAAAEFRIDERGFRRMLRCESRFDPFAGRRYKGLAQAGAPFWATQVPRFNAAVEPDVLGNVYSPFDNARVAARVISLEGYGQWSCRP